jgi:hypothetical protein
VATESKPIKLQLDADPRFAAGIGGAVRCLAETSGLAEDVCRGLQQATVRACLESFASAKVSPHVVELSRSGNRIEVRVDSKPVDFS